MIIRKQSVRLGVAMILALGAITTVALTFTDGGSAFAKPMKGKLLRRKDDLKRAPDSRERNALRGQNPEKHEKRELKIRNFGDMPLKIHETRNVDSETWYKDLEIEVKNIGTKPIYFMLAYLDFPDHKPDGRDIGFDLNFGDLEYVDISVLADPHNPHIDAGQTYVFKIPAKNARVLKRKHEKAPQEFRKLDFHIDIISFGDGTGFEIGHPLDLRKPKHLGESSNKKHHGNVISNLPVRSPPQDGCGSCGRYSIQFARTCFDLYTNQWCAPAPLIKVDSSKPCKLYRTVYFDCDEDQYDECPRDEIYDSAICPGYSPTPTPTPTLTPTPTPTPTPEVVR